ncbi:RDD family protein [Pseudonocardia thermophila]|uniref:RDD family protein n=2 Tax=Pseudonocardia thermophila TaxID=1848 RepID=A0A1M6R4C8_PSETH|nr:RDD family protein [Pseudonocardia thermophila]
MEAYPSAMASTSESEIPVPAPDGHPGARFGLPAEGPASVASLSRRVFALVVDWLLGYLIALLLVGPDPFESPYLQWAVLGVWFVITALPVAFFGASAGMVALGIRVASIGSTAVIGLPRALLRTLLVALVVPPLIRDADERGWHDRATRSIVVRTRA